MTDVAGRTAFITGGANGIGLGIARSLAAVGVKVALADVDATALVRAKDELSKVVDVETVVLDVRDREAYARAADAVEAKLGAVSLLFNNAGIAGGTSAVKMTYALWDWGIGINLVGVVNGIQTFLPRMAERDAGGYIVNTASGAGLVEAGSGVLYHMTKFGVVGLSEALRVELAGKGIGVSVLCPGPVATKILQTTAQTQPQSDGPPPTEAQMTMFKAVMEQTQKFLDNGVAPDAVGDMVLKAIRADQLYIYTDRMMGPLIEARTKALLAAIPPA